MGCGCSNNSWGRSQHNCNYNCNCGHRPPINPCLEKTRALKGRIKELEGRIKELEDVLACSLRTVSQAYDDLAELDETFDEFVKAGCVRDVRFCGPECCDCHSDSDCNCDCGCSQLKLQPHCDHNYGRPKPQPRRGYSR